MCQQFLKTPPTYGYESRILVYVEVEFHLQSFFRFTNNCKELDAIHRRVNYTGHTSRETLVKY